VQDEDGDGRTYDIDELRDCEKVSALESAPDNRSAAPFPGAERRDLFRFLVAEDAESYWRILLWLSVRRTFGELEVDFEELREGVATDRDLGALLRQLEAWGSLSTRIEPRKIRTLEDRRVERYRVMLGEETADILDFVSQDAAATLADPELAEDRLRALEAGLADLLKAFSSPDFGTPAALGAAASCVRNLKREAMQADKDLFLFAQAIRLQGRMGHPSGGEVALIVERLRSYIARYLDSLTEVRFRCRQHLDELEDVRYAPMREALQSHLAGVAEESQHLTGRRGRFPLVAETLALLGRFFAEDGELERRCEEISRATMALVQSLKRHLDELLTRSQRRALLRSATERLLAREESGVGLDAQAIDVFFDELWLTVKPHALEGAATPADREDIPLPGPAARRQQREANAFVEPVRRPAGIARSLAENELGQLNDFVQRAILKGATSGTIDGGDYAGIDDLRLLFRAVRAGRDRRNPMVKRVLRYRVELAGASAGGPVEVRIDKSVLTAPRLQFIWEGHDGG